MKIVIKLKTYRQADGMRQVLLHYGNEERGTGINAERLVHGVVVGQGALQKNRKIGELVKKLDDLMLEDHSFADACDIVLGTKQRRKMLFSVFLEFAKTKTPNTRVVYNTALTSIQKYMPDTPLDDVDKRWLMRYDEAMANDGLRTNTRSIRMRCLRAVFNYACDCEYTKNYPFRRFSIKQEETRHRALSIGDIRTIRDFNCEELSAKYRDIWMLMFYLIGINGVDLWNLTPGDMRNGYIYYRRQKTSRMYCVKIEPEAAAIIEKYRGTEKLLSLAETTSHNAFLHGMGEQLKHFGQHREGKMHVWTGEPMYPEISSYWSRHSWATIANEIGIPVDVIAQCLGHANTAHATTMIYIKMSQRAIDDANRRVLDAIL